MIIDHIWNLVYISRYSVFLRSSCCLCFVEDLICWVTFKDGICSKTSSIVASSPEAKQGVWFLSINFLKFSPNIRKHPEVWTISSGFFLEVPMAVQTSGKKHQKGKTRNTQVQTKWLSFKLVGILKLWLLFKHFMNASYISTVCPKSGYMVHGIIFYHWLGPTRLARTSRRICTMYPLLHVLFKAYPVFPKYLNLGLKRATSDNILLVLLWICRWSLLYSFHHQHTKWTAGGWRWSKVI